MNKELLESHMKVHDSEKEDIVFKCGVCDNQFTDEAKFKQHNQDFHEENNIRKQNDLSNTSIIDQAPLFHSSLLQSEEKSADENGNISNRTEISIETVLSSEVYQKCNHCEQIFLSSKNMAVHCEFDHSKMSFEENIIENNTIFKCSICEKQFTDEALFKQHKRDMHDESKMKNQNVHD